MATAQNTNIRPALKLIVGASPDLAKRRSVNENPTLAGLIEQHRNICRKIRRAGSRIDPAGDHYDPSLWPHLGDLARAEETVRREIIAHPVDTLSDFKVKAEYLLDKLNADDKSGAWLDKIDAWQLLMSVVGPDYHPTKRHA